MTDEVLVPETCREALEKWDAGDSVPTVEMGGLGLSYEQAIQVLAFELIREYLEPPHGITKPDQVLAEWGDHVADRVNAFFRDEKKVGSMTGAQVCAAKNLASRLLLNGYRKSLEEIPKDRIIQVSQSFSF